MSRVSLYDIGREGVYDWPSKMLVLIDGRITPFIVVSYWGRSFFIKAFYRRDLNTISTSIPERKDLDRKVLRIAAEVAREGLWS